MPICEYRCEECSEVFSVLVLGAQAASPECPKCASSRTRKLISSFSCSAPGEGGGGFTGGGSGHA